MLTCDVLFSVESTGVPVAGAIVSVQLESENNIANGHLIAKSEVTGATDAVGNCTLTLIQGGQFRAGGQYRITVTSLGTILHDRLVTIPDTDTAFADDLVSV